MTRITTAEAANHLYHSGLKVSQIPVGALVQFGPHKGDRNDYYFDLYRNSESEWMTHTSYCPRYGKNVIAVEVSQ